MNEKHPHTALGESIRAFSAEVEEVTRRLAELGSTDEDAAVAAAAITAKLQEAQDELGAEKQHLDELLEAERLRYRDLFEWAPDAYLVTDPLGTIMEANRAAEQMLGRARSFLIRRPLGGLLSEPNRRPFRVMLERLPALESVSDWELELCTRDGRVFPVAVTASCMRDRTGVVGSLRWLIRDISERKGAEEQVVSANIELERRVQDRTADLETVGREKEETLSRLEAILDQIPAAIVIADAVSAKIVAANDEAERLVSQVVKGGDALEHWLSLGFHTDGTRYPPEDRPITRALASGETIRGGQIEFHLLDGTHAVFEMSAAPVRSGDGEIVAAVAAYWDVTERERLARVEREFVTNAAHELRTPLAALASAVEVLQAGAKERPAHRDRFLAHVEQQCGRLQRLVRSLLSLARAQTGQEAADAQPIDVRSLLDDVAAMGPPDRLRVEVECAPGTEVLANRDLIEHALSNLISNAVKYAPEGEIVLRGRDENGFVSLEVLDSGPGMTPEERERAVERFYRGREEAEGFGLGLSIAAQAAEALGGRLEFEGTDPRGTRARLMLPAADA